ncbi:patatin-like phospholipase family protein [Flavobacterium sp.]|uniref:patatin-like phospholipase family protein n=1 Tax=Flavobacterium sp. TaxID=239 RepID=UPI00260B2AC9|nr:patatin-like phospholipase family protein [Flavobacterium sp.]
MRKRPIKVFPTFHILWLLGMLCFGITWGYSQAETTRPKVGVVLSGGGAKGFAHIGVLKVLEDAGVRIDYIGGTSMGAVVGGLYASGYSSRQIDSIFHDTNFDELLSDYIPRESKSFYEKHNDELYALTLPFDKLTIGIPIALSRGLYNFNLLNKLLHNVRHVRKFDQLPIPFVCAATNIETGEKVILREGYLPEAILASSAFPSLFSPIEIDGKLLIDGGVTNNYPVEEIRRMGADIIIGVDVQDDLQTREKLSEATRILVQISNLEMIQSMKRKQLLTDIYIKPDIKNYSVISFDKGKEIIAKGEEAARESWEKIKKLTNRNYQLIEKPLQQDSLQIDRITINTLNNYTRAFVIGKLGFKQGSKISYSDLKNGINKLTSTGNFSAILYQINPFNQGEELELRLTESKNKTFVRFGLHYDGLYKSAALVNLTQKKILFRNDVFSLDVGLGDNFRYNLDYYIDNGFYFSFGLKSRFNQFNRNVSTDFNNGAFFDQAGINAINVDYSDFSHQAYLQTVFAQKFLIGGGIELKHLEIKSKTLENQNQVFEDSNYFSVFGYLKYDSLDNKYFPKKGWFFNGELNSYLYSSDYANNFERFTIIKGEAGITRTFYKIFNLRLQSEAGINIGDNGSHYLDFVLGGYGYQTINNFRHFYGYDFVGSAADSYIRVLATVDVEFYKKNHINFSANYANLENKLFKTGNWLQTPMMSGYAVGYGLETVIGPIEVKYSWSPELPKGFLWFSAGFWF